MIALCLQCCPSDTEAAMDLAKLICEIEREKREDGEFFLVYRKDCDRRLPKFFENLARMRFGTAVASEARNFDTGWPAGSNMLAASAFIEMAIWGRGGICKSSGFLLFEPDVVPLRNDWIDQLSAEWDKTLELGKQCFGHWNMPGSIPENLHMNGNAVFETRFFDRHPTTIVGPGTQGWDFFYRDRFIPISRDSNLILQHYARPTIGYEELAALEKGGVRPAILHGVKDNSARENVRRFLFKMA